MSSERFREHHGRDFEGNQRREEPKGGSRVTWEWRYNRGLSPRDACIFAGRWKWQGCEHESHWDLWQRWGLVRLVTALLQVPGEHCCQGILMSFEENSPRQIVTKVSLSWLFHSRGWSKRLSFLSDRSCSPDNGGQRRTCEMTSHLHAGWEPTRAWGALATLCWGPLQLCEASWSFH